MERVEMLCSLYPSGGAFTVCQELCEKKDIIMIQETLYIAFVIDLFIAYELFRVW